MPPQKLTELCNAGEIGDLREEHDNDEASSAPVLLSLLFCHVLWGMFIIGKGCVSKKSLRRGDLVHDIKLNMKHTNKLIVTFE